MSDNTVVPTYIESPPPPGADHLSNSRPSGEWSVGRVVVVVVVVVVAAAAAAVVAAAAAIVVVVVGGGGAVGEVTSNKCIPVLRKILISLN